MTREIVTTKLLGAYLMVAAGCQIGLYVWHGSPPFLLDPRVGVAMLLAGVLDVGDHVTYIIEWLSGLWLLCLGSFIFAGSQVLRTYVLRTYIVSEVLLAVPTLLYLAIFTFSGGHMKATTPIEAAPFWLLFMAFSGAPVCLAIYCLSKGGKQPSGRMST